MCKVVGKTLANVIVENEAIGGQCQAFVGFEIFHLGRIERPRLAGKLFDFALSKICQEVIQQLALLRDRK